eukprot:s3887_g2.t4
MVEQMAHEAVASVARRLDQKKVKLEEAKLAKVEKEAKKLTEAEAELRTEMVGESAQASSVEAQLEEALANLSAAQDQRDEFHAKIVHHKAALADQRSTLVQCKVLASGALDDIKHNIDDDLDDVIGTYSKEAAEDAFAMAEDDMPDLESDVWPPYQELSAMVRLICTLLLLGNAVATQEDVAVLKKEIAEMELVIQNTLSEERKLLKEHQRRTLETRRNSNKVLQELKKLEDTHKAELSEVDEEIESLVAAAEGAAESLESHDVTVEQSFNQKETLWVSATEKKLKQVLDELDLTKKEHEEMDKQAQEMQKQVVDLGDRIRICKEDAVKAMSNAKQHALERFDEGSKAYE